MRFSSRLLVVVVLSISSLASDLTVRIVDPKSAVVSGAQVEVYESGSTRPVAVGQSSAQGTAAFGGLLSGQLRVHVLAPGFAEQWADVAEPFAERPFTIALKLALAQESVLVTATRTPFPNDQSGASVSSLNGPALETLHPATAVDAIRFLPGAVVNTAGQRGGLGSLFVRGGESRYNKVIIDGVAINDPGGTFDFGTLPLAEVDRVELMRGTQSTLYGSDAMTSVVQIWSRTGNTATPELRLGADAGNYGSENGYASLSGFAGRFDYNVFGNQFNTSGSGANDDHSNSLEGINAGARLNDWASIRVRARHDHSVTGVQNEWNFNGQPLLPPDLDQRARQNNFLGSLELAVTGPSRLQHRITGFDYTLHRTNQDDIDQGDRIVVDPIFGPIDEDFQFHNVNLYNRAGFDSQGIYEEQSWARSTFGYQFEDENGTTGNLPFTSHGVRRNHALYGQQIFNFERLSVIGGGRYVHNESFGDKFVPRVAATFLALKGGKLLSGTRLNFSYATGISEPTFAESFGNGGGFPTLPNPDLKPEETRAFEAGVSQNFGSRYAFSAVYFNDLFRNRIDFNFDQTCFCQGQYVNINEAIAHGAELQFSARPASRVTVDASYTYTSSQILNEPFAFDLVFTKGQPLIRRPKHSATLLATYLGQRWGADLAGSYVGRRADSDFFGLGIDHTPGYVLLNLGGWYEITNRITAYVSGENMLNRFYEEVTGYPALKLNFRAGMRFRVGGD